MGVLFELSLTINREKPFRKFIKQWERTRRNKTCMSGMVVKSAKVGAKVGQRLEQVALLKPQR